jgi:hypothetical protein
LISYRQEQQEELIEPPRRQARQARQERPEQNFNLSDAEITADEER